MDQPVVIGVGGFTSDVGKTTLMCELLRAFPGWEAIKTTRGHYRSCGKDPHACCVSHLLSDKPLVRSGREQTYEAGKDTGRYWDAGAANVHWLIATDTQVEKGIREALARVKSPGVFVEGNSFTQFVDTDYFVMVRQAGIEKIKSSARLALGKASAIYISDCETILRLGELPIFTPSNLPILINHLRSCWSVVNGKP
jgi:molybdopterin-guanine dinucleotide biosynthesis protein